MSGNTLRYKWNALSLKNKIQLITASILTVALMIALPVYAWFAFSNDMETVTKIKEPENLDIKAGNFDPIVNFDLRDINIESIKENGREGYVFSVNAGDYKIDYDLQLAHTNNIPLTYEIYHATEVAATVSGAVLYAPLNNPNDKHYYQAGTKIELTEINPDNNSQTNYGRKTAAQSGTFYTKTYDIGDNPQLYAIPTYLQTANPIVHNETSNGPDYFILYLNFDSNAAEKVGFVQWNIADNNKETDMIYLTAEKHRED